MKGFALHFCAEQSWPRFRVDISPLAHCRGNDTPFLLSLCVWWFVVLCLWHDRTPRVACSMLSKTGRCAPSLRVQLKFACPIPGFFCAHSSFHDGQREHDFRVSGRVSRAPCNAIATREPPFKIFGDAWASGCAVQSVDRRWRDQ